MVRGLYIDRTDSSQVLLKVGLDCSYGTLYWCMRAGEITSLRREQFDMIRRVVRLTDTKNGSARTVPLSKETMQVLAVESCGFQLDSSKTSGLCLLYSLCCYAIRSPSKTLDRSTIFKQGYLLYWTAPDMLYSPVHRSTRIT